MKVLTINTYAGSLLLAARARGDEIVASLEDTGYGVALQQDNFPELNVVARRADWPALNLHETIVIGHPPCAAFSVQNRGHSRTHGVEAATFKCTVNLLEYAMRNRAAAVAVESVPPALVGARSVHDRFAVEHGYDLYRIILNARDFGIAQRRKRFWALFFRKGLVKDGTLSLALEPTYATVADVVSHSEENCGTFIEDVLDRTLQQLDLLRKMLSEEQLKELLLCPGSVVRTAPTFAGLTDAQTVAFQRRYTLGCNYTSHSMVVLDGASVAPVLIAGSWWWYRNRCLYAEEYKEIMGFPRSYRFLAPYYAERIREYLSRGVCPPTARWILDMVDAALAGRIATGRWLKKIQPGEIADFCTFPKVAR